MVIRRYLEEKFYNAGCCEKIDPKEYQKKKQVWTKQAFMDLSQTEEFKQMCQENPDENLEQQLLQG